MEKYFGYVRKSPDDKEETEVSINNQIEFIKKIAGEKGFELVEIFVDKNISGSDRKRKEFLRMVGLLYDSDIKGVIVKDSSRFARDSSFFRDTLIDFNAYGKMVYSCMKGNFLSHEDLGDAVSSMVDDNYIVTQRKKADLVMKKKLDDGKPINRPPFGYKINKNKDYQIVPKEAKIILKVVSDYFSGRGYRATINDLKIHKAKYYRILRNAQKGVYSGFIIYERKIKDSNKKVVRVEQVKYRGDHEPIITDEMWGKINGKVSTKE